MLRYGGARTSIGWLSHNEKNKPKGESMSLRAASLIAVLTIAALAFTGPAPAGSLSCDELECARSKDYAQSVTLHIVNESIKPVTITWIDYDSKQKVQYDLAPGEERQQKTYATHPWVASSLDGACICAHIAEWASGDKQKAADKWVIDREADGFEPTETYEPLSFDVWTIKISGHLSVNPTLLNKSVEHLKSMLNDVKAKLPVAAVNALSSNTTIWLEKSDCRLPSGVYHPSLKWLKDHSMNPAKVNGVQFSADHLHESEKQPAMVLHEFAHAFLDRFVGVEDERIVTAFKNACASGRYDMVDTVYKIKQRAYALENQMEFFAELSESYFWENDYYPYRRALMEKFDPASTKVIAELWSTALLASKDRAGQRIECPPRANP